MTSFSNCGNKRRRHSSEPSPSILFTDKPLRKKLLYDIDIDTAFGTMSNDSEQQQTSNNISVATGSISQPQPPQSLFTDNDVQRLASAVKTIMIDDLRRELKSELQLYVNHITTPLYSEIDKLKFENFNLKKSMNELPTRFDKKVDDLEQHSRKSCIRISGVPQSNEEDTTKIVCDIASKLDVKVEPNDISVSHRLPTEKGHKQIIARFTHARKRTELLRATKNIKQVNDLRGVGISVRT